MTWNYRIVRYANGSGFGLHGVFYDKEGKPVMMTTNPASFVTDEDARNPKRNILQQMKRARKDVRKYPVFDEPQEWVE